MSQIAVACDVCGTPFEPTRPDASTCSARCRQRKRRAGGYVLTAADRAAIDKVMADDSDLPPRLTPAQVQAFIVATAVRG